MTKDSKMNNVHNFFKENNKGTQKEPSISIGDNSFNIQSGDNSPVHVSVNNQDHLNHDFTKSYDRNGREHFDDSAVKQGRQATSLRKIGDKIDIKHMTPKEYKSFKFGLWDGVELRRDAYNWEAFKWNDETEVKTYVNRRIQHERRRRKEATKGRIDRRSAVQRKSDQMDAKAFWICSSIAEGILWVWALIILVSVVIK